MPRYRLLIEYDGTPFVGWQFQANGATVQQALEDAIARFSGEQVRIQGAGRTDTGVHATGQVAHVDLARDWPTDVVRDAVNAHLRPAPVALLAATRVPDTFNARTSAVKRHYVYRIVARRAPLALDANRAWHIKHRLDAAAMHDAAQLLVGRHDFTTFRAAECQAASPVKSIDRLDVERIGVQGDGWWNEKTPTSPNPQTWMQITLQYSGINFPGVTEQKRPFISSQLQSGAGGA